MMQEPVQAGHSRMGIASFIISILTGIVLVLLVVVAGVMEASTPGGLDENSVAAILLGFGVIGFLLVDVVAFGLGVAGVIQRRRKKVFAIFGTVFSALVVVGVLILLAVGLVAG